MSRYSFESYTPKTSSQSKALVVARKVLDFAKSEATEPSIVVFSGGPGVGKTHLIEAIRSGLEQDEVDYTYFSGRVPGGSSQSKRVVIGDDAFSAFDKVSGRLGAASWSEIMSLNERVLNDWYPNAGLVVFSSNFSLQAIQNALREYDTIGRASSRLNEMSCRGVDVPIVGNDHRQSEAVVSLFE